ncbi:NAD(P)H-hydrate dehydratase [Cryobacterium sp.]|jgi:ADP-dependent NAD(P)H-hydrate dehydratase|uniref:NAD(P)H-hydrate dehydratase n=1 Tax=Cryobacterium sp. TaxID=1926290 RepID=UPI00260F7425|nr:NAD(P)H-hydrate dehydratase [Cryobacterium sp.]MCU1445474.1 carbohydrate kinase, YjeF related protein [Cryobacterium sp.]
MLPPTEGHSTLTPALLRDWPLPAGGDSKYARGQVVVVGGARKAPGGALLAGTAALRVGAGRLTLGVGASVAVPLAVAVPEAGVVGLPETSTGAVRGGDLDPLADELRDADAVVLGSGLDDADETKVMLGNLPGLLSASTGLVLDAFALGALASLGDDFRSPGALILTPNPAEAGLLLGRDLDDLEADIARIAARFSATVSCQGVIAAPDGRIWLAGTGQGGLGTSGSGDVLAGAIGGLLARGATEEQAACWGTWLHAAAGDRLNARVGPTGYLARELSSELPRLLAELGQHA